MLQSVNNIQKLIFKKSQKLGAAEPNDNTMTMVTIMT